MSIGKHVDNNAKRKQIKYNLNHRYDSVEFGVDVRKRKKKQASFQPNQEYIDQATADYLARGGTVTQLKNSFWVVRQPV